MGTQILDSLKIGACGHKAMEAEYYIKVFTACHANQTAFLTLTLPNMLSKLTRPSHLLHFRCQKFKWVHVLKLQMGLIALKQGALVSQKTHVNLTRSRLKHNGSGEMYLLDKCKTSRSACFVYGTPGKGDLTGDSV